MHGAARMNEPIHDARGSIERRGKANLMQDLTNGAQVAHT